CDFIECPRRDGLELQLIKYGFEYVFVRSAVNQEVLLKSYGSIRNDLRKLLRKKRLISIFGEEFLLFALQFRRMRNDVFNTTIRLKQSGGCFWPHARNAGDVVRSIPLKTENVNDLTYVVDVPLLTNLLRPENIDRVAHVCGFVKKYAFVNKLPEIFSRGHHVSFKTLFTGLLRHRTNNVIRLVPFQFKDRDIRSADNFFHFRNTVTNVLRHFLAGGFVF